MSRDEILSELDSLQGILQDEFEKLSELIEDLENSDDE